ncbi:MAG: DNA-formamidopyrimidine glycosylase family protein [Rothia sp. (in: high G+C Gram-positive bacteria)]|nr:DNA-formamidopyrimidine glycosylase family protein [Rothia sp. (in: high G+C Gram-positive bacteria)]
MPEGDTVWRQARSLHRALAGRTAHTTDFRYPRVADINLAGQPIHGALARGKHLLLRIGEMTVHSHLKMEGIWHLYGQGTAGQEEKWRRPSDQVRAIIRANARLDSTGRVLAGSQPVEAVGFSLGLLEVFPTNQEADRLAYLGPDLLGPDWSLERAVSNLAARPERPLGVALLDQKNLAGIGTIYRTETCFLAGLDPRTPVGAVPNLAALVSIAHLLLDANRGRPHRVTRTSAEPLWCYGRAQQACYRCGETIIKENLSESGTGADRYAAGHLYVREEDIDRISFRCPGCQELVG